MPDLCYSEHPVSCRRPSRDSYPVTGCDFLAYSCAAARELHPLPCLRRKAKTRKPKDISKNRKYSFEKFTGTERSKSTACQEHLSKPSFWNGSAARLIRSC